MPSGKAQVDARITDPENGGVSDANSNLTQSMKVVARPISGLPSEATAQRQASIDINN